jgi:hypothetical protein
MSCAAPEQGTPTSSSNDGQVQIQGRVTRDSTGVPSAFVRLLDHAGDFTAEVVSGPEGQFRFFAAPGSWTLRALAPGATGSVEVVAGAGVTTVDIQLSGH